MFRFPVWLVMVAMLLALAVQHSGALNLATIQHGRRALLRSTSTATKLEKAGIHASDGVKYVRSSTTLRLSDSDTSGDVMDEEVREAIEKIVKSHKVVLFMKGDSSAPMW